MKVPIGIGINEDMHGCWADNNPPDRSFCRRGPATSFGLCLVHHFDKTGRTPKAPKDFTMEEDEQSDESVFRNRGEIRRKQG